MAYDENMPPEFINRARVWLLAKSSHEGLYCRFSERFEIRVAAKKPIFGAG
jgi:hypothetical protein